MEQLDRYYYAEITSDKKIVLAYTDLTHEEFSYVAKSFAKQMHKYGTNKFFIFGNMSNIKKLGELSNIIKKHSKPYQADIEYLINNTEAYYLANPWEVNNV